MKITIKNVFVEIYHSIDQIEQYHDFFRRVYTIIVIEIFDVDSIIALQMAFKAINDSVESKGFVLILFVFDAYFRMIESNAPFSTITQRATAMKKAMKKMKKITTSRQINDAVNTKNDSFIDSIHDLSLNAEVFVFRENNTGRTKK